MYFLLCIKGEKNEKKKKGKEKKKKGKKKKKREIFYVHRTPSQLGSSVSAPGGSQLGSTRVSTKVAPRTCSVPVSLHLGGASSAPCTCFFLCPSHPEPARLQRLHARGEPNRFRADVTAAPRASSAPVFSNTWGGQLGPTRAYHCMFVCFYCFDSLSCIVFSCYLCLTCVVVREPSVVPSPSSCASPASRAGP